MDAGENERELFSHLAEQLWTGDCLDASSAGNVSQPSALKARLERLLVKATQIREKYQTRLCNVGDISDVNFARSLTTEEMTKVHNAWMNDVTDWMSPECLQQ